jgi:hypothetical protein
MFMLLLQQITEDEDEDEDQEGRRTETLSPEKNQGLLSAFLGEIHWMVRWIFSEARRNCSQVGM